MKPGRLTVKIRSVPDRTNSYIAYLSSPVLGSTFSLLFPDSITGALALNAFSEMLRLHYEKPVELQLENDLFPMKSEALQDILAAVGLSDAQKTASLT